MSGRQPSVIASPDSLRAGQASQMGDSNMAPGGLTFGRRVDGGAVGPFKAIYRKVSTKGGASVYNLAHNLGFVPAFALYIGCDTAGNAYHADNFEHDRWTATEVRVKLFVDLGGLNGTEVWFIIGGER